MKESFLAFAKGGVAAAVKGVTLTAVKGAALSVGNGLLTVTSGVLAASMISYSSLVIYDTAYTQNQAKAASAELLSYRPTIIDSEEVPLSGSTLSLINDDYRAWLTIQGTAIDYPVVQGQNDLYYASHDIYKNASLTGAIYVAAANSPDFTDSYNLIYGHHMDQNIMFGALDKYLDASYLYSHQSGVLATDTRMYDLTVFAVAETDAYEQAFYRVGDRMHEVTAFLREPGDTTTVAFLDEAVLSDASQIIAFSTCASATTNGCLVVLATMRERLQATGYSSHSTTSRTSGIPGGTPLPLSPDGSGELVSETVSETEPGTPGDIVPEGTDTGTSGGTGSDPGTPGSGTPGGTGSGTPDSTGSGTPGGTGSGTPDGTTPGTPGSGTPDGTESDTPDGVVPGGTGSGTPGGTEPGTPNSTEPGTPGSGTPTGAGTSTPNGTEPGAPGSGTPIGTGNSIPDGTEPGTPVGDLENSGGNPETPLELTEIDDDATPLARFTNRFQPRGISYGGRAWALVNLIALFCTAYLLLPMLHVRAKYCRAGTMKKINRMKAELRTASNLDDEEVSERLLIHREAAEKKARDEGQDVETAVREAEAQDFSEITQDDFSGAVETLYYHIKKYIRRFRLGIVLELALVALAAYVFIHTENIRLPMVLIDKWTPLMLLFLGLGWLTDICLTQYRDKLSFSVEETDSATDAGAVPQEGANVAG